MKTDILLCVTTEPIKVKHICWFCVENKTFGESSITLCELVEETHPHPQVPQDAIIHIFQVYNRKTVRDNNPEGAAILLLKNANLNILNICQPSKSRDYSLAEKSYAPTKT